VGVERIEAQFNARFARWDITLPREAVADRTGGHVFAHGWHIGLIWGEEKGEQYLELLAQHRMTSDNHLRIFASGRVEALPAVNEFFAHASGADEVEIERARHRYYAHNSRVSDELRAKGLLPLPGENLPAHEINEYLRSGGSR